ncbi:nucleotide-binding protein [Achromatium sp. WMS3]|nr:nucleotide-binding protein [Achromatium sp. WMS3]
MNIISNATPLIAFSRINRLQLLRKITKHLIIPEAVAQEISNYDNRSRGAIILSKEPWIDIAPVKFESQVRLLLPTLDRGEAEVIALALEQQSELVLMDELTGRKIAESLNLTVCGSIGILIKAKQMEEIAAVKPLIDEMRKQGIYYGQKFINAVLKRVNE